MNFGDTLRQKFLQREEIIEVAMDGTDDADWLLARQLEKPCQTLFEMMIFGDVTLDKILIKKRSLD